MKLTTRNLPRLLDGLEGDELVGAALRMHAAGDASGVEAVMASVPRKEYSMLDAAFVDPMTLSIRAVDRFAFLVFGLMSERESLCVGGRLLKVAHKRACVADYGIERWDELRADNEAFTAEHGHHAWWAEMGLDLSNLELVLRYELTVVRLVATWDAFDEWCVETLGVDGRTTLSAHLNATAADLVMGTVDRAIAERECAEEPRWADALQQHVPIWVSEPDSLDDADRLADYVFNAVRVTA